jgi:subtilisin family serine protease
MKIKSTLIAATSALAISIAAPSISEAGARYDFAMGLKGQNQITYAQAIIKNYNRMIPLYERLVNAYGHYSWAASFKSRLNDYREEVRLLQTIIDQKAEQEPLPTKVGTEVVWSKEFDVVQTGVEQLVDTRIKEVEEESDGMMRVYEEITRLYEREDTVRRYRGRVTYTIWSNGERQPLVNPLLLSTEKRVTARNETERKFVREYAIVVPEEEPASEFGTPTEGVLTAEQYRDRDDVMMGGTQNYMDAAHNTNPNINPDYINRESGLAPYANSLGYINAPEAWAKGWTGKGSTIAILDTGIDMDHSEFAGRIKAAECFTGMCNAGYETVDDGNKYSHGTHVAGIAAAALDGKGTTGVAPDADLLIAKTAWNNGYYEMAALPEAITWSVNNGADAINVSGNVNVDFTYRNSITGLGDGVFRSTDTRSTYATLGYNNMMGEYLLPSLTEAMSGNEAVLVVAAGNQGLDTPGFPAHYAIAEDASGELSLGGRVLVAGNWDVRTNKIHRTSNRAGTMCFDVAADGTCATDRRISDYYLLAPGVNVAAPDNSGEYRLNSGTSMAAPAVTGGVALIHQMWPHMKGENIAQLLLNTADKTITGYDENIHGQGLMDLNEATTPQGVVGIPTTGRVDGATSSVSGGMAIAGANIGAISSLMVVDDYDRDFYVDGNNFNNAKFTGPASYDAMTAITIPSEVVDVSFDERNFGVSTDIENWTIGATIESETFLGNYANNELIDVNGAQTVYAGYNWTQSVGETQFFAGATMGITNLNVGNAMMKSADLMVSNSANIGFQQNVGGGVFSFTAGLPVGISSGSGHFDVASSVSTTGDIETTQMSGSLANNDRPVQLGINWKVTF